MKGKIYHTGENKGITIPAGGIKHDAGKTRWDLLPLRTVEEIVKVYTFGAEKYGDNNWQNLPDGYDRYKAAMFRHLVASERGGNNWTTRAACRIWRTWRGTQSPCCIFIWKI